MNVKRGIFSELAILETINLIYFHKRNVFFYFDLSQKGLNGAMENGVIEEMRKRTCHLTGAMGDRV